MMTFSSKRRHLIFAGVALALLQVIALLIYLQVEGSRRTTEGGFRYEILAKGPHLPAVELARADGTSLSSQTLKGGPVLLHFWATSCPPCREELPGLLALEQEEPGLRVVALACDDDWATVRKFFGGEVPSTVFLDPAGALLKRYEVGTLPDTYLLDANGVARVRFNGARNWRTQEARLVTRHHGK